MLSTTLAMEACGSSTPLVTCTAIRMLWFELGRRNGCTLVEIAATTEESSQAKRGLPSTMIDMEKSRAHMRSWTSPATQLLTSRSSSKRTAGAWNGSLHMIPSGHVRISTDSFRIGCIDMVILTSRYGLATCWVHCTTYFSSENTDSCSYTHICSFSCR